MVRSRTVTAGIGVALLVGGACVLLVWQPWHGPIVLSLATNHGVDMGDLPALALLALAVATTYRWRSVDSDAEARGPGRWAGPAAAIVLGGLLLADLIHHDPEQAVLLPAGGGTFGGATRHADADDPDPVDQWSHAAVTYDGAELKLYVNGDEVSSREISGTIRQTTDPLWLGGNKPYGEHFDGLIDEVRMYDRALSAAELRAEMSAPIGDRPASAANGLVAAYGFDAGSGSVAADASGHGNAGVLRGPTWTTAGRFGAALRFDGSGQVVRIPASASLDLTEAMTLSAWVRPRTVQAGWRTVVHRQTDAYFLMAGGGGMGQTPAPLDDLRVPLLIGAAVWLCLALVLGRGLWLDADGPWWPPVALFLLGSAVDASLTASGTVIGPTLVAFWYTLTARRGVHAMVMLVVTALLIGVTAVALTGQAGVELTRDDGGVARSAALGLVLVAVGVLAARDGCARRRPRPRWPRRARADARSG